MMVDFEDGVGESVYPERRIPMIGICLSSLNEYKSRGLWIWVRDSGRHVQQNLTVDIKS